jgi:hypothetical protein
MRGVESSYHSTIIVNTALPRGLLLIRSLTGWSERSVRVLEQLHTRREHRTRERAETRIVQRLESRFVHRIAATAVSRAATVSRQARRDAAVAHFPRLAMTLARPSATAPVSPSPARPGHHAQGERSGTYAARGSQAAALAPLPAKELSRVTEHVLRTLDRRVLSYRERTGQV